MNKKSVIGLDCFTALGFADDRTVRYLPPIIDYFFRSSRKILAASLWNVQERVGLKV